MKNNYHPSRYLDPPPFPARRNWWPLIVLFAALAVALLAVIACLDA